MAVVSVMQTTGGGKDDVVLSVSYDCDIPLEEDVVETISPPIHTEEMGDPISLWGVRVYEISTSEEACSVLEELGLTDKKLAISNFSVQSVSADFPVCNGFIQVSREEDTMIISLGDNGVSVDCETIILLKMLCLLDTTITFLK